MVAFHSAQYFLIQQIDGPSGAPSPRVGKSDIQPRRVLVHALQGVARGCSALYLSRFPFSGLPCIAPYCAPLVSESGLSGRMVSAGGRKPLASAARVGAGSCKLVGGDGPIAQQVGVRAARRGDLPALAPPQPPERRPNERPSAHPRSPLAPRARGPGRGGCGRAGRPRTPLATGAFRRGRCALSGDGKSS
jgi:hypothetical protein